MIRQNSIGADKQAALRKSQPEARKTSVKPLWPLCLCGEFLAEVARCKDTENTPEAKTKHEKLFFARVHSALWIAACLIVLSPSSPAATLPTGFVETTFASGLSAPTAMDFAPDGRLFICQQGGSLRVVKNGALLPTPFITLNVDSSGERGLLGIAFDPNFGTNNFLYVYYTVPGSPPHNRVSRFTANGDVVVVGSEMVLLDLDNLSSATNHNGGAIHFGPDGKLYVAVGENANPPNSQTPTNLLGKVLRINSDGTIPPDNPFFGTAGARPEIWALGLRNPFTFAFQPGATRMFINDVGQNTWEEINDGIAGSNYGWPTTEGPTSDPRFRGPLFAYGHGSTSTTGCAITGGTFYNPATAQFPAGYTGKYFFADLCTGWIRVFDPANSTAADFASGIVNPVDLKVNPDGSLFYLAFGSGAVFKVQYSPASATITTHPANQTVMQGQPATFTVSAGGSAPISYQWQRNQVNINGANSPSYTLSGTTLADSGAKFRCVVSNSFGNATSNEATLTVNAPPAINANPTDQTVTQGQTAMFLVNAVGSTPLSYQWQRNTVNIASANSPSYLLTTTFADNGAKFRCVVTNSFGNAISNEATLTVNAPPNINTNPLDQTVTQGQGATFTVSAGGSIPLTYQWQRDTVGIPGATLSSYTLSPATQADNGAKFRCVVTNSFGNANSNEATLTVQPPPPTLVTEENTDRAIALDSVNLLRDPFPLTNLLNFSSDNHTRVMLFATNLDLLPGEDNASVTASGADTQLNVYPLTVEYAGALPALSSLTEVIVVLPDNLPAGQDILVKITWHGMTSNKARIRIK
jgi:glucose/arabinose dehydrogenase